MLNPARKKKNLCPIFPSDPVGAEFCKWFWSLNKGWDWIVSDNPAPGEKARWITEPYPIQPNELWRRHQDNSELVGVGFQDLTRYINLDIDRGSAYHPYNDQALYDELLRVLRSIGLVSPIAVRSSWSEGLHVYYPLPKAVSSFGVACAVKWTLFDQGILLGDGQLETFPNTKPYARKGEFIQYKSHRLPLQPESGSYLLDASLEPYSDSVEDLLDEFNAAAAQQNLKLLKQVLEASWKRQALSRGFGGSDRAQKWRRHLERQISTGWTAFSQTNSQIKDIATYGRVFVRLDGRTLINYTVETALSAPGYEQFCRHQGEIWLRASDWCKCVEAYYWPYGSSPSRDGRYSVHFHRDYDNDCPHPENNIVEFASNDKRSTQARERIRIAVAHLESSDNLPSTATARSYAIIATSKQLTGTGVSQTTLHKPKYLPLWHPDHYKPQAESCVIDRTEPIPAVSDSQHPPQTPSNTEQAETLNPAPRLESGENYTSDSYMKGLCVLSDTVAPQGQPCPAALKGGESEGGKADAPPVENLQAPEVTATDPQPESAAPVAGAAPLPESATGLIPPNSALPLAAATGEVAFEVLPGAKEVPLGGEVPPAAATKVTTEHAPKLDPELSRRVAKIRLEAICKAQAAVRMQRLAEGRLFSREERELRETIAKMRFFWESGEPALIAEVQEWATANPDALPEVLPLDRSADAGVTTAFDEHASTLADNASKQIGLKKQATVNIDNPCCTTETSSHGCLFFNVAPLTNNAGINADMESMPTAEELELEAYYLNYLEAPNPADFECPCESSQPDPDTYDDTYEADYLEEIPDPPDSEPAYEG